MVRPFLIGRELDCDVRIDDGRVSRKHVEVACEDGRWIVRDRQSGNGVFVNGKRVERAAIDGTLVITLGADGPAITFSVDPPAAPIAARQAAAPAAAAGQTMLYVDRYFAATDDDEPVGGRTMMIRKAFQKVQKKQQRKYTGIVALVAALAVAALGYAFYSHRQIAQQKVLAEELFYSMKWLDVDIANLERTLAASGSRQGEDQVRRYLERRRQMETNYDRFIANMKLYDHTLTAQEQLVLRVTRLFGE